MSDPHFPLAPACHVVALAKMEALASADIFSFEHFSRSMTKLHNGLKPIPESEMSPEARVASRAHRSATRKKRAELRRRGLPMIIWKDGKVQEIPA
jgi:hypothetical protein